MLASLQDAIVTRLKSDEVFGEPHAVEVFAALTGDIERKLEIAWAKVRLLVLIHTPGIERAGLASQDVRIPIQVAVFENAMLNRSQVGKGLMPLKLCQGIWALLYGWRPDVFWTPVVVRSIEPVRRRIEDTDSLFPEFIVNAETTTALVSVATVA